MTIKQLSRSNSAALPFSDAFDAFMLHQRTSRHTAKTIEYYNYSLGRLRSWLEAQAIKDIAEVDANAIRRFLLELEGTLKPNSIHGIARAIRALFSFLVREEMLEGTPMARVKMPKTDKTLLPSFTPEEIQKLEKGTEGKDPTNIRNRAIVLLLLDSGLRLSECASLSVGDIDPQTGLMQVMGKGRKERVSKLGATALKAFAKYSRIRGGESGEPLWIGKQGPMTSYGLAECLEKLGKRVGVHAHPHKFRRSCALMMLRSGADVFSVQYLLGHADLGVMRRYLAQTDSDIATAHERHSPVDSLRLREPVQGRGKSLAQIAA